MTAQPTYSYATSVKSDVSDELINTYVLRPAAGLLVRLLYRTPLTPNHVTIGAIIFGVASALFYAFDQPVMTLLAGLALTVKDLLDSADGQLARAKHMYSRAGRFLDSLGDLLVNFLVFAVIAVVLTLHSANPVFLVLGPLSFIGITLRVSYHVFYQTSFLHLEDKYTLNRITEELQEEDRTADALTRRLQVLFLLFYGWQDRLMVRLDRWCRGEMKVSESSDRAWYGDRCGLRLSGVLGLGTELLLLTICSAGNHIETYLYLNLILMNAVCCATILYRRCLLAPRLLALS
jgi:phosphatidylglycerophosphate synthase